MAKGKTSERITVASFMSDRMVTIDSQSSVADAAKEMVDNKISSVVVTKAGKIVGIATERDIVKAAARDVPLDGVTIGSLMSAPLASIANNASVEELAEAMIKNRVRHLVVKDPDSDDPDDIVGIASVTDVARYIRQKLALKVDDEILMQAVYPTEEEGEKLFWQ